jgi:hypothetical protein
VIMAETPTSYILKDRIGSNKVLVQDKEILIDLVLHQGRDLKSL